MTVTGDCVLHFFLKLIVVLCIYLPISVFAQSNSKELLNEISLRQDFYNYCLFNDIEPQIDLALQSSDTLSSDEHARLLYSKATQYVCRNENQLAHQTLEKLTGLPENKINQDYYIAALLEFGVIAANNKLGEECKYFDLALKKMTDTTQYNLRFIIQLWHNSNCAENEPVITLRKSYQLLQIAEQKNYPHLKADILHNIAFQFAINGQAATSAKIREQAIELTLQLDTNGINIEDYFNLTRDYIDAGDIINAEKGLAKFIMIWNKQKDNSYATKLKLILTAMLANAQKDFIRMKNATDEMQSLFNGIDSDFNSNIMSILHVIACYETEDMDCVDSFMVNIKQHLSHPRDGKNTELLKFLVTYYLKSDKFDEAYYFLTLYTQESESKLIEQQNSALVLGVAKLNQDIIEMDLDLAKTELKESQVITYFIAVVTFITIFMAVLFWYLSHRNKHLSETDTLTHILNRRAIIKALSSLKKPPDGLIHAVVLFDLDEFKGINDTYGHAVGDLTLQHIVKLAKRNIRKNDEFGRIGGEEFLICLKNIDAELARNIIERIRKSFESSVINLEDGTALSVTASFSLFLSNKPIDSFESIYQDLDAGLYAAKNAGRNVIIEV
jgi:diguanylate cyclase (GGDEF)-like protein